MTDLDLTKLREQFVEIIDAYSWDGQGYASEIADLLINGPLAAALAPHERKVAAKALREASSAAKCDFFTHGGRRAGKSFALFGDWLRKQADQIEAGDSDD